MGCCDTQSGLLPLEDALQKMVEAIEQVPASEQVAIEHAVGRVLAEPQQATLNVPPHDNSAMDGYAVVTDGLAQDGMLTLVGKSFAGHPFSGRLNAGECVRIMTGAAIPNGADAVVMQEHTTANEHSIQFHRVPSVGENIRRTGDDITAGDVILPQGRQLRAADIGLLASIGKQDVPVYKKLRIGLLSTGDELMMPGEPLSFGDIYESNSFTLGAMLHKLDMEVVNLGVIPDNPEYIRTAFDQAMAMVDVIITSGGVSVGEADFVKPILEQLGEIRFWKLAIKPGKPFTFGKLGNTFFLGLPGNPVSAQVTFHQLGLPFLQQLGGGQWQPRLTLQATAADAFKKKPGRRDFQRGVLSQDAQGQLVVHKTGTQSSGVLTSMAHANCYIILPEASSGVDAGEPVTVEPFDHALS